MEAFELPFKILGAVVWLLLKAVFRWPRFFVALAIVWLIAGSL